MRFAVCFVLILPRSFWFQCFYLIHRLNGVHLSGKPRQQLSEASEIIGQAAVGLSYEKNVQWKGPRPVARSGSDDREGDI